MWVRNTLFVLVISIYCTNAQNGKQCNTPNGENAICLSIYKCPKLLNVVQTQDKNQLRFVQESQCGYDKDPLVCCGTLDNYGKITRTETESTSSIPDSNKPLNNPNIPSRKACGFQENNRIFGGEDADMDEFPWMALLQYRNSSGVKRFACGGTLISPRYVLTAAHCVKIPSTSKVGPLFSVRLGEWKTDTEVDCITVSGRQVCNDPPVDIEVESTAVHQGYSNNDFNRADDIALIRLKKPVTYTSYVRPICLPQRTEMSKLGELLTVAGWGQTETTINSTIKQKVRVPLANKAQCTQTFTRAGIQLGDKQLCAGGQAGKDSCKGDSGGPLMRTSPSDITQWYIEGVVSFGARCGTEGWPGIYTRVTAYLDWIYSNVKA